MIKYTLALPLVLFFCLRGFAQQEYVFLGSYNQDKDTEGIYVYKLDSVTGGLTKITSSRGIKNPSYLTISPDRKFIYACTESKTPNAGSVSAFEFDPEKQTLTFLNSQRSGGENPVYLSTDKTGKWLINGNYTEAGLSVYPILENGKIDSMVHYVACREGSVNPERQEKGHIHAAIFSPKSDQAFFPDLGADKIRIYPFNGSSSKPLGIEKADFVKTEPGGGPRHLTFSPNGRYAYLIEEMAGAISAYSLEQNHLKLIQRIYTHPARLKSGFESSDVHISPDGKFLYATNRGKENNIAIFKVQENGMLKSIGYQSTHGKHPRTFAITSSGNFLIVTNVVTSNVVVFKRNKETGLLKKAGKKIEVRNVSCVKTGKM